MSIDAILARYKRGLEVELEASVTSGGEVAPFHDMLRYHLGWLESTPELRDKAAGKRLRPALCLLACEAVGGNYRSALAAAVAVELIHNFTLIHDDIQDTSPERRYRPTVWKIWGVNQAINAGDAMYAVARLALLRLRMYGVSTEKIVACAEKLDTACLRVCEGQYLDLEYEKRLDVAEEGYLSMIRRKTAALLGCATEVGAFIGCDEPERVEYMRGFGENLGLAYQIQDDVLGIWGEPKMTGKPAAADIRQKKKGFPVVCALSQRPNPRAESLAQLYSQAELADSDVQEAARLLDELGVRAYAMSKAESFYKSALDSLAAARLLPEREGDLCQIVEWLRQRSY